MSWEYWDSARNLFFRNRVCLHNIAAAAGSVVAMLAVGRRTQLPLSASDPYGLLLRETEIDLS
jgi:hypothetical protein